jgi:serine/threonine-protein kinase
MMTVQWLDAAGKMRPMLRKPGPFRKMSLSPDGNRVALESGEDIWVYDSRRELLTQLTFGGGHRYPVWTPDGRYIVFTAAGGILCIRADGSAKAQSLTHTENLHYPVSFSPDGKRLAFNEWTSDSGIQSIWTVTLESDDSGLRAGKPEPFLRGSFDFHCPSWSPDGQWLAYSSNENGTYQLWVRHFPDTGGKWLISTGSGLYPVWSRNRHELFFRTFENEILVVDYIADSASFQAAKPRRWSDKTRSNIAVFDKNFDLTTDGKQIVTLVPVEASQDEKEQQHHVTLLLNFFDELRRRVPVDGKALQ